MRSFIAIDLPEDIKAKVLEFVEQLKSAGFCQAKWLTSQQLHLTLKFLGEVHGPDLDKVKNIISSAAGIAEPFDLELKGFGHFNYRVFWISAGKGEDSAVKLAGQLDSGLSKLGFAKEIRPYKTHLTLARVKFWSNKQKFMEILEKNKGIDFGSFPVTELKLIKSTLTKTGPIYETLEKFPLGQNA